MASTPNETPQLSSVDAGNLAVVEAIAEIPQKESGKREYPGLKKFNYQQIQTATTHFSPENLLADSGSAKVFKGWIDGNPFTPSGVAVAVKRFHPRIFQSHQEWLAEVKFLGQLFHPNLVTLLGYCSDSEDIFLVYEFMPKGNLDDHLFKRISGSPFCPLSWILRIKIAIGIAKGLAFLHYAQINVVHHRLQSSNILLDRNYNAKLSNFGLTKNLCTGDLSPVHVRVIRTHAYAAPEYIAAGFMTTKSDVYSFGVVLLEILSGRRALDYSRPTREASLVEWGRAYINHKNNIFHLLDSCLEGQCARRDALKAAKLAYHCLSIQPDLRPNMNEVVKALEELQNSIDAEKPSNKTILGMLQGILKPGGSGGC